MEMRERGVRVQAVCAHYSTYPAVELINAKHEAQLAADDGRGKVLVESSCLGGRPDEGESRKEYGIMIIYIYV